MSAKSPQRHIKTLERRLDFLNGPVPQKNSFLKAERGALTWALSILRLAAKEERAAHKTHALTCSICLMPQKHTPSGWCCANGHGGADSL